MELADDVGAVSNLKFEVSGSNAAAAQQPKTGNQKIETYSPGTLRHELNQTIRSGPVNTSRAIPDLLPTRRSFLSRVRDWDDQESWRDFFQT